MDKSIALNSEEIKRTLSGEQVLIAKTRGLKRWSFEPDSYEYRDGFMVEKETGSLFPLKPPYQVGDLVRVREPFGLCNGKVVYRADYEGDEEIHWFGPQTMKTNYSRITLRIEKVRVKRLFDVTEEDAMAYGFRPIYNRELGTVDISAKTRYLRNWQNADWVTENHKQRMSRNNPWVWFIEYRVVSEHE